MKKKWRVYWRYKVDNPLMQYCDDYELPYEKKKDVRKWWTKNHNKFYNKKFRDARMLQKIKK